MRAILREPKKIVPLCIAALFFLTIYMNSFPCTVKVVFYPIYREIAKKSFVENSMDFNALETTNFRIYYRDSSGIYINMIEDNAEQSLERLLEDFDYSLRDKIDIIIYPEYSEMAGKVGLGTSSMAMGVYYEGTISVLEPEKWIRPGLNMHDVFKKDGPVLHELTHYVLDYMSGGNMPVWFTEGVALYEEYRHNDVEWAQDKIYTTYYSVDEIKEKFYELDEIKAYKESFLVIKYIGENYGIKSIQNIIKDLRYGKSIDQSIKKELNMELEDLFKISLA
jgi:hypothetical protein